MMGRRKVPIEYIQKDRKRSTTYEKRKKGLMKKAYELATLCDVPLCMVIYPAVGSNSAPVTFPENEEEVTAVLKRYVSGSREENAKRTLNLEQALALVNKKKKRKTDPPSPQPQPQPQPQQPEPPYPSWHLDGLSRDDLLKLASLLDCKLLQVQEWMKIRPTSAPVSAAAPAPVNGGDHPMKMQWPMCNASSSIYDPNSYLPDNNALPSSPNYSNSVNANSSNALIPISAVDADPVNRGDNAMMTMWSMSTASSPSAYDLNSYLLDNNGFPRPYDPPPGPWYQL